MHTSLFAEIHYAIRSASDVSQPRPERRFHKTDEYVCYGLKTSVFRAILNTFRPRILALSLPVRFELASQLLGEHIGELGHAGICVLAVSVSEITPLQYEKVDRLPEDFRSWSHVDALCIDVLQPLLWNYRDDTLALLQQWNQSANQWKRRASVVTFVRKVGKSGLFTDEVIRFCDTLIEDKDELVQKGVGWALKDNLRSAPARILAYIEELRRKGAPSTITLYAIRDLQGEARNRILSIPKTKKL